MRTAEKKYTVQVSLRWKSLPSTKTSTTKKKPKLLTMYILLMRNPITTHARLVSPLRPHLSVMQQWVYGGEAHSSCRQNETWPPARWRGGMEELGAWWDEMRGRRDGEKTHPADSGGCGCRSPPCMSTLVSLAGEQRRGGCSQTISKERYLWGKKESWREREVEILVLRLCWMDYSD